MKGRFAKRSITKQDGVRKREVSRTRTDQVSERDCVKLAGLVDGQRLGKVHLKTYGNFEGLVR